jgi:hypothetical protein
MNDLDGINHKRSNARFKAQAHLFWWHILKELGGCHILI